VLLIVSSHRLPTPQLKTFSTPDAFTSSHSSGSATVVYSSKEGLKAGSSHIALVHYYQPEPVIAFRDLQRTIQVSHWSSSVAFEDSIELINNGPA
jgi:oligosaccharyltransferase complex subunit alpha (ribophorin I)